MAIRSGVLTVERCLDADGAQPNFLWSLGNSTEGLLFPGQRLWVTNNAIQPRQFFAFSAGAPEAPAAVFSPAVGFSSNPFGAIAFAPNGDAWVSTQALDINTNPYQAPQIPNVLARFSKAKLLSGGAPAPDITLQMPNAGIYNSLNSLAFAANGDLWAAFGNLSAGALVKFNAADLLSSGTPTPAVILGGSAFVEAYDIAFDGSGNLLVAAYVDGPHAKLHRLSPSQLATSNPSLVPDVSLVVPEVNGIAIDATGKVWASQYASNQVSCFLAADLATSGTPTALRTITGVTKPVHMQFDAQGNLWVASYPTPGAVLGYAAADIATGGSKTPAVRLTAGGALKQCSELRFGPA